MDFVEVGRLHLGSYSWVVVVGNLVFGGFAVGCYCRSLINYIIKKKYFIKIDTLIVRRVLWLLLLLGSLEEIVGIRTIRHGSHGEVPRWFVLEVVVHVWIAHHIVLTHVSSIVVELAHVHVFQIVEKMVSGIAIWNWVDIIVVTGEGLEVVMMRGLEFVRVH